MLLFQLLRAPVGSRLVRTDFDGLTLTLGIVATASNASCPVCGHETGRSTAITLAALPRNPFWGPGFVSG